MGAPKHVLFVQNMFAIFGIFLPTLCVNCKFKMFHSNWCKVWAKMKSFNVFGLRLVLAELETTCAFKAMRWCAKRCSIFRMDPEHIFKMLCDRSCMSRTIIAMIVTIVMFQASARLFGQEWTHPHQAEFPSDVSIRMRSCPSPTKYVFVPGRL